MNGPQGLLLVAHDGGGASILASVARVACSNVEVVAQGPAVEVFSEFGVKTVRSIPTPHVTPRMVLVGTSASSMLELETVRHFNSRGVRTLAFLDHWENYRSRFARGDVEVWPQAVAVADEFALEEALRSLPLGLEIVYWPNPYHSYVFTEFMRRSGVGEARVPGELRVLWLAEPADEFPLSSTSRPLGYCVTDVAQLLDSHIRSVSDHLDRLSLLVRVRLHPRQRGVARKELAEDFLKRGWCVTDGPLEEDLAWCDLAVGTRTSALFVAKAVGRPVGVLNPPKGRSHSLPGGSWDDALSMIEVIARAQDAQQH